MSNETLENRIIEAARQQFIKKGYECTSMSDIAALAGINRPTLHYYFRTKEKMFQAVFGDILKTLIPQIQNILTNEQPFLDKLSILLDMYFSLFTQNPEIPYFILNEIQRDPEHLVSVALALHIDQYAQIIQQNIQAEMKAKKLRTVELQFIAMTFYSLLICPFLIQKLLKLLLYKDPEKYAEFLQNWKRHILSQMGALLSPQETADSLGK